MKRGVKIKKKYWEYFIVLNLLGGCLIFIVYSSSNSIHFESKNGLNSEEYWESFSSRRKIVSNWTRVLFWTGYFDSYELSAFGITQKTLNKCPVKCQFTFDRTLIGLSDAVIYHIRDLKSNSLPSKHLPHQVWIFYMLESADNTRLNLKPYSHTFNWTMTYRRDSDVYHPYGLIEKIPKSPHLSHSQIMKKLQKSLLYKEKEREKNGRGATVSWVVSNCFTHSNRESYVQELENYIQIHKYGSCGEFRCEGETSGECYEKLARTYKFYLAFENSLCVEYVTEKFYEALKYDMVPIVYGRANYSLIAPPNSFIDAREFSSPAALAKYLIYLDRTPSEYLKYLSWKFEFRIRNSDGWCNLCRKLKNNHERKSYRDIENWWRNPPKNVIIGTDPHGLKNNEINNKACLPVPYFENESWFSRIRKKYFILPT